MDDISGPSEVRNDRYGATCESLKDYAGAKIANRGKHQRIGGS
jgi:hypothetical protein